MGNIQGLAQEEEGSPLGASSSVSVKAEAAPTLTYTA